MMIFEKIDKKEILRWDMDEKTRLPNGKLYNFIALSPEAESIAVLDGITEIGYGAFAGCTNLRYVKIPKENNYDTKWTIDCPDETRIIYY
jgi:hypothetical protein